MFVLAEPSKVSTLPAAKNDRLTFRSPPQNVEAEQALLGAILINNETAAQISGFLVPEHFFEPIHGRIFEAMLRLIDRGQIANPTTLRALFERDEALAEIGGADYLKRLAGGAVTIINAEDYGRLIHDMAVRRQLIAVGEDMVNIAYDSAVDDSATMQIEAAEQRLYNLAEKGRYEGGFRPFSSALVEAVHNIEQAKRREGHLTGVGTGLRDLDARLGGLHSSDLVILAGRPSMGKTALATNIAVNAARAYREQKNDRGETVVAEGAVVAFFSLEMSAEQLAARILSEETGIPSEKLRRGQLSEDDFLRLVQSSQRLEQYRLFIDDTPALSIATLRARARRLKRLENLGMVVVDYLQLVRPASSRGSDNRVLEIADITQGLKALAKELNVPVLALSQLSRQVEQRDDKRPQLSDLRESGAIEQDADIVMFIFREEYYHERKRPTNEASPEHAEWKAKMDEVQGIAEVIVGKHRHGPTGTVKLLFNGKLTKFANLANPDSLPESF
ncbi:MAG: replicative DNA helicase [Alphaproteobacteria bacterium]|nr:replicative DNA helicase [Alphaproteobacteria bacterium]